MRLRHLCLLLSLAMIANTSTSAEPGPVSKWLMSEPATRWDLGMARLAQYFTALRGEQPLGKFDKGVSYDWKRNKIEVYVVMSERIFDKALCRNVLNVIRKVGGVIEGKYRPDLEYSHYAKAFESISHDILKAPRDTLERLDAIIMPVVYMRGGRCQGGLVSTKISYPEASN